MSVVAAMVAGGAVGVTHALEADHLAAMATLVDERRSTRVGASWGIGHTLPILLVGIGFVALGIHLPERVTQVFEAVVGVALVAYGLRLAADAAGVLRDRHDHDGSAHEHLRIGGLSAGLGQGHGHVDRESLVIGVLHGLAGSGGLVVAMATTAPSIDSAIVFLLTFGVLTTVTMTVVATLWGRTVGSVLTRVLKGVGGSLGAIVGVALVLEVTLGVPLLP